MLEVASAQRSLQIALKYPEGLQFKLNTLNEEEASAQPEQPDEEEGAGLHAKAIQDPAEGAASASAAADEGAAGNLVKHVKSAACVARRLGRKCIGFRTTTTPSC